MDDASTKQIIANVLKTWVQPEIEARRAGGRLTPSFTLSKAQVIFDLESPRPVVRLNEEIRVVLLAKAARAIKGGETVAVEDLSEIREIHLTDLDPNAAHVTLIFFRGSWHLAFDFRYNATRIGKLLDAARQFLDCAGFALNIGHLHAGLDNLFSAVELMAKSIILRLPDEKALKSKKHGYFATALNLWGKLGNVDPKFTELLNTLSEARGSARYLERPLPMDLDGARNRLALAEEMYAMVRAGSPTRKSRLVRRA